jgi:hypothetical protein
MKTYTQFQEDVSELRGQLQSIEKQDAPAGRLAARRVAAKQTQLDKRNEMQANVAEYQAAQRERVAAQVAAQREKQEQEAEKRRAEQ